MASLKSWREAVPGPGRTLARSLATWSPRLLLEVESLAKDLSLSPYSLLSTWMPRLHEEHRGACSVVGVARDKDAIVGRNFDLGFSRVDIRVIHTRPDDSLESLGAGGFIGRFDGLNSAGLVVAMSLVETKEHLPPCPASLPPSMLVRVLLEGARTTKDAVSILEAVPGWSPVNYLLADASGNIAVVERSQDWFAIRSGCDGILATTNHFVGTKAFRPDSERRYEKAMSHAPGSLESPESMASLLHSLGDPRLTRWSDVFLPGELLMRFSGGYDCGSRTFTLPVPGSLPLGDA